MRLRTPALLIASLGLALGLLLAASDAPELGAVHSSAPSPAPAQPTNLVPEAGEILVEAAEPLPGAGSRQTPVGSPPPPGAVVELADTAGPNPAAGTRGGSNPPGATIDSQEGWLSLAESGRPENGRRSDPSVGSNPTPSSTNASDEPQTFNRVPESNAEFISEAELYEALAGSPWPRAQWARVVAVARCESTLRPDAVGDAGEVGVLQIHPVHRRLHRRYDLTDVAQNLAAAWDLYRHQGWPAWTCAT